MQGTYDFTSQASEAAAAGTALMNAASSAFRTLWPVAVGVIALVVLAFWIIRRAKQAASTAR